MDGVDTASIDLVGQHDAAGSAVGSDMRDRQIAGIVQA
jgi:hypothetical protein